MGLDKFRKQREEADVDLIPVMNLFVVLIPFLLLCAAFYHVGVIPTSLPSQSQSSTDISADPEAVTVTLAVDKDQIHVSVASIVLDEETLDALAMSIPVASDGSDLELLGKALYQIKQMYAKSDTVIVLPGEGVVYREVVRVLDAARELTLDEGEETESKIPLFPVVVLSRKVV